MSEVPVYGPGSRASMFPSTGGASSEDPSSSARGTYFLGRYRIVEEIGVGGMASVHLARMDGPGGFQKWAAVKKIHAHLVDDESIVQMFLDEARVAARISHPNVATVFELDKHDATHWIAMEYLHGEPLREVMRSADDSGAVVPAEIACRVIVDAAEGLHAAHELTGKDGETLNLVHRDVSPHNIFVTYEGVTKVVDFGIAKFSSRANHTGAGVLKGKLAYMSPEQARSGVVDRRTDVFALGVVLWELTTGKRLFWMESDFDTLMKVEDCVVPRPSELIPSYPLDLEEVVMKALSRDREQRFGTARELSRALQSLLMRRDIFVTSDEVAAYMQEVFAERIRKRDAQLRWAAEVTQTNVAVRTQRTPLETRALAAPELSDTILATGPTPLVILGARSSPVAAPDFSHVEKANVPSLPVPAQRPAWFVGTLSSSLALCVIGIVLAVIAVTRPRAHATAPVAPPEPVVPVVSASASPPAVLSADTSDQLEVE